MESTHIWPKPRCAIGSKANGKAGFGAGFAAGEVNKIVGGLRWEEERFKGFNCNPRDGSETDGAAGSGRGSGGIWGPLGLFADAADDPLGADPTELIDMPTRWAFSPAGASNIAPANKTVANVFITPAYS